MRTMTSRPGPFSGMIVALALLLREYRLWRDRTDGIV